MSSAPNRALVQAVALLAVAALLGVANGAEGWAHAADGAALPPLHVPLLNATLEFFLFNASEYALVNK